MVAYYFPPIGGIGSIRAAAFAKFLPEFGWEATVLAPADTPHPADGSLDVGRIPVVRTRSLEITRLGRRRAAGNAGAPPAAPHQPRARSAPSRWLRRVASRAIFPDPQIGWYPAAVAGGTRLLRERRFDLIFSSAFPPTSHVIARTLKRRSSVPWVAEWRDPWSDDPGLRLISAPALRLERAIAADADAVVLPNQTFVEHYSRRWGVAASVIGHGSDAEFPRTTRRPSEPVLAYIGTYYPDRQRLDTLWLALAAMRQRGEAIPRLRWVGHLPDQVRAELEVHGLRDILDVTGFVSHTEALSLMAEASALIATGFADRGFLSMGATPAKLLEYIASGVPIIYVGHADGEAARLLTNYRGCHTVEFDDVEGAATAVRSAVDDERHEREVAGLSRRARTAELAALFDTVVGQ
jgi:glycosyltransferase involved in cell wall biosynthesis